MGRPGGEDGQKAPSEGRPGVPTAPAGTGTARKQPAAERESQQAHVRRSVEETQLLKHQPYDGKIFVDDGFTVEGGLRRGTLGWNVPR